MKRLDEARGCSCHPAWAHAHDRQRSLEVPVRAGVVVEGRRGEREHSLGAQQLFKRICRELRQHRCKILGVRNGIDLSRAVNADRHALGLFPSHAELLQLAENYHLKLVGDKIPIPDFQLIVERRTGDVEVANVDFKSRHYHRGHIRQKQRAGFSLGGHQSARAEPIMARRVYDGPDIVGHILSRGR